VAFFICVGGCVISEFQIVQCKNIKANGYECRHYLGAIEVTRPNVSRHYCSHCNVVQVHSVDENGIVEVKTMKEKGKTIELPSGGTVKTCALPYTSTVEVVDA
jgi:hypothetical protein